MKRAVGRIATDTVAGVREAFKANEIGWNSADYILGIFDGEYRIPADLVAEKKKVTVRFEGSNGRSTPSVFGVRIVRADVER